MNNENGSQEKKQQVPPLKGWMIIAVAVLALTAIPVLMGFGQSTFEEVSLLEIVNAIEAGEVETLTIRGDLLVAATVDGSTLGARKESSISAVEALQILGTSPEALKILPIVVKNPEAGFGSFLRVLLGFAPIIFIGYVIFRMSRQLQGGGMFNMPGRVGRSNPRVVSGAAEKDEKAELPVITFDDVAGEDQAKLELREVVEFLEEAEKFIKLGARVPKGVLMVGPPGTGKTLMAKAVAGEAGVPFFSISGSEFVEMFVGVGASRVRDLFKRAREQAPAVIFIDEIDAVGRRRGVGLGGGNDEREQTLNQILVEMDGFNTDTNVIMIAATNRPDVLDPALLRPGRFDRKVVLDRPDVHMREAILEIHMRGMPLNPDVHIPDVAKLTPGFVGADLENLVNEAAILAARRDLTQIGQQEFQDAMERIVAGPERKTKILGDEEREVVAYHEAGHAVVMHNLENSDPVHKVSIISRGMALGYTMPLPESDKYLRTKEAFEDEIVGLLGGRAAEETMFSRVTTGAANDLERATDLARAMVTRYGFSEKLGLRTFGEEQGNPYLGNLGEMRNYSEKMAQAIDQEISHIITTAYQRAKQIIDQRRRQLEALAKKLLETETVDRTQFEALMA
jgi:cell division protease FtsH